MLRRLLCFTLLVLLTPALAVAQRCEVRCVLAPAGHAPTNSAGLDVADSPQAAASAAPAAADSHAVGSSMPRGCTLMHLPALLRQPVQATVLKAPAPAAGASAEFRSVVLAPPEPRPKAST